MFKALMGGSRSSSDVRSSSSSKSKSRRRTDSKGSTVSRKSSRGDDRDRGLGDLSAYPSSSSKSRRNASSVAGESVASSYATAEPGVSGEPDPLLIERTPKRRDYDDSDRRDRYRGDFDDAEDSPRRRTRARSPSQERERPRSSRYSGINDDHDDDNDDNEDYDNRRRDRRRTRSGDAYYPPVSGAPPDTAPPHLPQFPPQFHNASPDSPLVGSPHAAGAYDPHVEQQFPGQFPAYVPEPYSPPNPAGEAADYYGDQGQSVAQQPGVRPKPPLVASHDQAHLMTASPTANPPPEPSSIGEVGAAAAYYTDDVPDTAATGQPGGSSAPAQKPPRPSKPSLQTTGPAAAAATYGVGNVLHDSASDSSPVQVESPTSIHAPPTAGNVHRPPHSHGIGASLGVAAAGAAAGYAMGSHHQSSSVGHSSQYTLQNYEEISPNPTGQPGPSIYPPYSNAPAYGAVGNVPAGYATDPSHPHHAALYHSPPLQAGQLALQRPQRGPMDKFIDFWRDPEGVGMFEDYTEAIGVCKYCFEPGTTSRDAPRKHHHKARRNSSDRYSNGSRVDKLIRYGSSDDEGRRRKKSSRNSWLPGMLAGYGVKSLFNNKDFDDTYSVRSGRVVSSHDTESVSTGHKSHTSRGVYRRSHRSRSGDRSHRSYHVDSKVGKGEMLRIRSRSRSRSSSRSKSHSALRDAALGAAVGTAAMSASRSHRRSSSRSRSPRRTKSRTSSSSDSSVLNISRPSEKSVGGGIGSFFSASSENRKKRRTKKRGSIFSFNNNSSSSSLDADLAFGNGYSKVPRGKSKKKNGKKDKKDLEARLLGMGAVATALVAARKHRRPGEILAAKDSRSGRSDFTSSASNDEGWEDLDSGDQSPSSVSSGLAFGGEDSHSSDSGRSIWGWRWGGKKDKKKGKKESDSKDSHLPSAAALGAGALGTAALASAYNHRDGRTTSQDVISSTGSLQHVAPVPTSDPSRFDAIRVSSMPPAQPTFVRPGPIPLQQPQPVTPVSQAVYTSQGETMHAFSAPTTGDPAFGVSPFVPYEHQSSEPWGQKGVPYPERGDVPINRPPRRSDSSPVFPTEPLEGSQVSGLKRRSTAKDQASVSFDLTQEQEDKARRADRLDRLRRNAEYDGGVQLIDRESELGSRDPDRRSRRSKEREAESGRYDGDNDDRRDYERDPRKSSDSSSWVGPAAVGAIGAAAAASALSSRASHDDSSETSQRRSERREKRRAERRGASEPSSTVSSAPLSNVADERSFSPHEAEHIKTSAFRDVYRKKPVYDDYAQFFAPEVQRYSPDTYHRREPTSMPMIIEVEPANERTRTVSEGPHPEYDNLPWPIPTLKVIEPTPPQSLSGSVRDIASPVMSTPEIVEAESPPQRPTTGSRVSWGEHEMHEYEVPSTSSDHDSVDHDLPRRSRPNHKDDLADEDLGRDIRDRSPKNTFSNVDGDIDFAATVAAATAAAGFDPSLVTDDPAYHTRSSPPGSEVKFVSPWTQAPVGSQVPHGFVEGEVETPDDGPKDRSAPRQFIENEPPYSEPEPVALEEDVIHQDRPRSTIAQEVIEQLGPRRDDRRRSESPPDEALSMPGGFSPEVSPSKRSHDMPRDISQSLVSAPMPADCETPTNSRSRSSTDDLKLDEDDTTPAADGGSDGKKKRRKRRSKRDTDDFEDSASVTSSPARIGEAREKSRSIDEKQKPASFLSSIFGSKVSEAVENKRSSSTDRRTSREVQSDIGTRSPEGSRHRRKEKSSSRRSSSRADTLDGDSAEEDSAAAEKENINVEGYKSSRQRREERRRQRYEDTLESGKGMGDEKVRSSSEDNDDEETKGLGLDLLEQRPRSRSESLPLSAKTIDLEPKSQSRPTSPELAQRQGGSDRDLFASQSAVARSNDSPTAVPLHFRRPPTSPSFQRSPSANFPTVPSPGSPTHTRPRRPNSTEFRTSREIRPLWLVERHGSSKVEPQPDEPLPSLPSSKTSSASASVEDLNALSDEKSWEMLDYSQYIHGAHQPRGFDQTTSATHQGEGNVHSDIFGSQEGTPTAATFGQIGAPSSAKKDKPKYEFHSPSELLQDPSVYGELPPSPTMGPLPSVEGSAVGMRKEEDELRPSTPENKSVGISETAESTPTQSKTAPLAEPSESSKGMGIAGSVGAVVAAAVGLDRHTLSGPSDQKHEAGTEKEEANRPLDFPLSNDKDIAAVDDTPSRDLPPGSFPLDREIEGPRSTQDGSRGIVHPADLGDAGPTDERREIADELMAAEPASESIAEVPFAVGEDKMMEDKLKDQASEEFKHIEEVPVVGKDAEGLAATEGVKEPETSPSPIQESTRDASGELFKGEAESFGISTAKQKPDTAPELTPQGQNETTPAESEQPAMEVSAPATSKKKKNKDRKNKDKKAEPSEIAPALPAEELAPEEASSLPEGSENLEALEEVLSEKPAPEVIPDLEASRSLEPDVPPVSEASAPEASETPTETADPAVSSKKSKRDKKKKKKSKGSIVDETPEEPTATESTLPPVTPTDDNNVKPAKQDKERNVDETPVEEVFEDSREQLSPTTREPEEFPPEVVENVTHETSGLSEEPFVDAADTREDDEAPEKLQESSTDPTVAHEESPEPSQATGETKVTYDSTTRQVQGLPVLDETQAAIPTTDAQEDVSAQIDSSAGEPTHEGQPEKLEDETTTTPTDQPAEPVTVDMQTHDTEPSTSVEGDLAPKDQEENLDNNVFEKSKKAGLESEPIQEGSLAPAITGDDETEKKGPEQTQPQNGEVLQDLTKSQELAPDVPASTVNQSEETNPKDNTEEVAEEQAKKKGKKSKKKRKSTVSSPEPPAEPEIEPEAIKPKEPVLEKEGTDIPTSGQVSDDQPPENVAESEDPSEEQPSGPQEEIAPATAENETSIPVTETQIPEAEEAVQPAVEPKPAEPEPEFQSQPEPEVVEEEEPTSKKGKKKKKKAKKQSVSAVPDETENLNTTQSKAETEAEAVVQPSSDTAVADISKDVETGTSPETNVPEESQDLSQEKEVEEKPALEAAGASRDVDLDVSLADNAPNDSAEPAHEKEVESAPALVTIDTPKDEDLSHLHTSPEANVPDEGKEAERSAEPALEGIGDITDQIQEDAKEEPKGEESKEQLKEENLEQPLEQPKEEPKEPEPAEPEVPMTAAQRKKAKKQKKKKDRQSASLEETSTETPPEPPVEADPSSNAEPTATTTDTQQPENEQAVLEEAPKSDDKDEQPKELTSPITQELESTQAASDELAKPDDKEPSDETPATGVPSEELALSAEPHQPEPEQQEISDTTQSMPTGKQANVEPAQEQPTEDLSAAKSHEPFPMLEESPDTETQPADADLKDETAEAGAEREEPTTLELEDSMDAVSKDLVSLEQEATQKQTEGQSIQEQARADDAKQESAKEPAQEEPEHLKGPAEEVYDGLTHEPVQDEPLQQPTQAEELKEEAAEEQASAEPIVAEAPEQVESEEKTTAEKDIAATAPEEAQPEPSTKSKKAKKKKNKKKSQSGQATPEQVQEPVQEEPVAEEPMPEPSTHEAEEAEKEQQSPEPSEQEADKEAPEPPLEHTQTDPISTEDSNKVQSEEDPAIAEPEKSITETAPEETQFEPPATSKKAKKKKKSESGQITPDEVKLPEQEEPVQEPVQEEQVKEIAQEQAPLDPTSSLERARGEDTLPAEINRTETGPEETQPEPPMSKKEKKKKKKKSQSGQTTPISEVVPETIPETVPETSTDAKQEFLDASEDGQGPPVSDVQVPAPEEPVVSEEPLQEAMVEEIQVETPKTEDSKAEREPPIEPSEPTDLTDTPIPPKKSEPTPVAEIIEEPQSSSKKKKKDKKKKRQSTSVDEGQPSPITEEASEIPEKLLESETSPETTPEVSSLDVERSEETTIPEDLAQESKENDIKPAQPTAVEETPKIPETVESQDAVETPEADPESQTTSSKKKKKDKKKRKSVSFATEEPTMQKSEQSTSEPTDPASETVDPSNKSNEQGVEDAPTQKDEESQDGGITDEPQQMEALSAEPTQEAPIASEVENENPSGDSVLQEEPLQSQAEPESEALKEATESTEDAVTPAEEGFAMAPKDETLGDSPESAEEEPKPDVADESQLPLDAETPFEATAPAAESQTAENDVEEFSESSKSKKSKKKKASAVAEEAPAEAPEPISEQPLMEEKAPDAPVSEEAAAEPVAEPEKPEDDEFANMSAKERKKAKKKKKRQSKGQDVENDESAPQKPNPAEAEASDPALETATAPAEDDGKDNQSHDTGVHGTNDKDLTWTDDIVSSQVEQRPPTSPTDTPQPVPERNEPDLSFVLPNVEGRNATEQDDGDGQQTQSFTENGKEGAGKAEQEIGPTTSAENLENKDTDLVEAVAPTDERKAEPVVEPTVTEESEHQPILEVPDQPAAAETIHEEKLDTTEGLSITGEMVEGAATTPALNVEGDAIPESTGDRSMGETVERSEIVPSDTNVAEPAAPSRKLSKKERKKQQREAQKAANMPKESDSQDVLEVLSPGDKDISTDLTAPEIREGAEIFPEESVQEPREESKPQEDVKDQHPSASSGDQLIESAVPESQNDTGTLPEVPAQEPEEVLAEEHSKPVSTDDALPSDAQPIDSAPFEATNDTETLPEKTSQRPEERDQIEEPLVIEERKEEPEVVREALETDANKIPSYFDTPIATEEPHRIETAGIITPGPTEAGILPEKENEDSPAMVSDKNADEDNQLAQDGAREPPQTEDVPVPVETTIEEKPIQNEPAEHAQLPEADHREPSEAREPAQDTMITAPEDPSGEQTRHATDEKIPEKSAQEAPLSRKESKKQKKKAKKDSKRQSEEIPLSPSAPTDIEEEVAAEKTTGVGDTASILPIEERNDVSEPTVPSEGLSTQPQEPKPSFESVPHEAPIATEEQTQEVSVDVPDQAAQEPVGEHYEESRGDEAKYGDKSMPVESEEAGKADTHITEEHELGADSTNVEPAEPISRKQSKKDKRKAKKKAKQEIDETVLQSEPVSVAPKEPMEEQQPEAEPAAAPEAPSDITEKHAVAAETPEDIQSQESEQPEPTIVPETSTEPTENRADAAESAKDSEENSIERPIPEPKSVFDAPRENIEKQPIVTETLAEDVKPQAMQPEPGLVAETSEEIVQEQNTPEVLEGLRDEQTESEPVLDARKEREEQPAVLESAVEENQKAEQNEPESVLEAAREVVEEQPAVPETPTQDLESRIPEETKPDEDPPSRTLSKKEKKKRRKASQSQEAKSSEAGVPSEPATDLVSKTSRAVEESEASDPRYYALDDDFLPSIDWEKDKLAATKRQGQAPRGLEHEVLSPIPEKRSKEELDVLPHKHTKVSSVFPDLERGSFRLPEPIQLSQPVKDEAEDETVAHKQVSEASIPAAGDTVGGHAQDANASCEPQTQSTELGLSEGPTRTEHQPTAHKEPSVGVESVESGQKPEKSARSIPTQPPIERGIGAAEAHQLEGDSLDPFASSNTPPLFAPKPVHELPSSIFGPAKVEQRQPSPESCELRRSPSIHGQSNHPSRPWSLEEPAPITDPRTPSPSGLGRQPGASKDMSSPPRTPLQTITEQEPGEGSRGTTGPERGTPRLEMKPEHILPRPKTPVRKFTDNAFARQTWPTPDKDLSTSEDGGDMVVKKQRKADKKISAEALQTPEQGMPILRPTGSANSLRSAQSQRSLRRMTRSTSGDLRAAASLNQPPGTAAPQPPSPPLPSDVDFERIASSSSYDPVTDKGKRPLRTMTDVYEGWGETPSSPRSPSRPPSVRHRRSMQHLQELETRLDQLISENRLLIAERESAEEKLQKTSVARRRSDHALNTRDADLRDREAEVEQLKNSVDWLQKEVSRLNQENEGLTASNSHLTALHVTEIRTVRESSTRELDDLRLQNRQLSKTMQDKIRQEVDAALAQKNVELRRLREELENARDKVKELQQQIAASMNENVLVFRDEDYFDAACQKLCGHVQQWVLRFSKHSDHRRCRKLGDLQDEKIADRFDNAILDGSDADAYLADRVRRRDVFMSVVMTMVWEFVFTRYLFGMDREQRQKLKSLEKQLAEVGQRTAIHRWRATTLTLLSKRPTFSRQRDNDTEAVALEIFDTLSRLLPPPTNVESQLLDSLRKVLRVAVTLSIEMRTQLAEYIMLPPLQPEYDTNGDLARQVLFNASLMNERSGETTSNEELESQQAVVRVVLFPLVVKKGDDTGEGEDEVVVCPAQVLIARPFKDKRVSKMQSGDRMSLDANKSVHSVAPSSNLDMSNVI